MGGGSGRGRIQGLICENLALPVRYTPDEIFFPLCMYVSVVCMHVWLHAHMCASSGSDVHLHVCVCAHVLICAFSCVHLCVQTYICICVAACGGQTLTSLRHLNCSPLCLLTEAESLAEQGSSLASLPQGSCH